MVGLSGGIDSAVVSYILKSQGYEVEAITMRIWPESSPYPVPKEKNSCFHPITEEEVEALERLSKELGIKHHTVDLSSQFEKEVLGNFKSEYLNGRTPNPCVFCNSQIKFGAMLDEAKKHFDFDYFATGHYARIEKNEKSSRYELKKGKDVKKDQSYFLSRLTQSQLGGILFPLGDKTKDEVRAIDEKLGFHKKGQSESQDFYSGEYALLLNQKERKGDIILKENGKKLGEHMGFWNYTIGQRKGLKVSYPEPLYVLELDKESNTVYVGVEESTIRESITSSNINYISETAFSPERVYQVKVRSASPGVPAKVSPSGNGKIKIDFLDVLKSPAPGQLSVIYDKERVIASAIID